MEETKELFILWTNDDVHTANLMVMMYARNAMMHRLWQGVTVIIWGATAKLAAENEVVGEQIEMAQQAGVRFSACIACARQFGVKERLEGLGIEVVPWVEPLTELIKSGKPILTI